MRKFATRETLGTGLRNRFFVIILATLILATVCITVVHNYFFASQRITLIDQQLTESSNDLLNSHEFRAATLNPESLEEVITTILRGRRIGKVFVLRDKNHDILYQSENITLLRLQPPTSPERTSVVTDDQYIRVRNVKVPVREGMVLQVGVVLDKNFITWQILNLKVANYIFGIVAALFIASVLLTLFLLAPLRTLISHLSRATSDLSNLKDVEPLPGFLGKFAAGLWAKSDEFAHLITTVGMLIRRINQNHKLTKTWTLQMAHELKTPLTVITAVTEGHVKSRMIPEAYAKAIGVEVKQMSKTINDFLDWAELENSSLSRDLHAIKVSKAIKQISARIDNLQPGRLQIIVKDDFSIFANPSHLDQLITNLITNALKFSPLSTPVEVELAQRQLIVRDEGGGIPSEVVERLGEPFNVGPEDDDRPIGTGLGLAWVATVARLYNWEFVLRPTDAGTEASVVFPSAELSR